MSGQSRWWMADLPWSNTFCTFCTFCTHLAENTWHTWSDFAHQVHQHILHVCKQWGSSGIHCCIAPMHLAWVTPCEILHQKTATVPAAIWGLPENAMELSEGGERQLWDAPKIFLACFIQGSFYSIDIQFT